MKFFFKLINNEIDCIEFIDLLNFRVVSRISRLRHMFYKLLLVQCELYFQQTK